ncbi:ATP-binding protein [Streptomyces sp. AK02-04a]|uniref:ATP-binding protein n=1 Tax=Streptomyces sp. AK02-04a TaxID=3028649 RepID=UPI0029B14BD7|nr:ATP-binding protein [Streptomyces sp. AK02-04a]MDX3763412.1 ATP-binding protein [Streptomyces sp. AK02-04a]
MTPSFPPGKIERASLPARDQTLSAHIAFSFPRTPVEPGMTPATRDLVRVGEVRRVCSAKLRGWGLQHCVDPALLLLSELVTNAIWHGSDHRIGVRLSRTSTEVKIQAWGGPVTALTARAPDALDEHGRGLLLVSTIADGWGINDAGWVWCTIVINSGAG